MDFKEFSHGEGHSKYNIYASSVFEGTKKVKNIIYKYENDKAIDLSNGNEYKITMGAPFKYIMAGSINMNLDGLIDKLISEGVLTDDFDYMSSYDIIRSALELSTEFRTSTLTTWAPYGFDDEPITYVDEDKAKEITPEK